MARQVALSDPALGSWMVQITHPRDAILNLDDLDRCVVENEVFIEVRILVGAYAKPRPIIEVRVQHVHPITNLELGHATLNAAGAPHGRSSWRALVRDVGRLGSYRLGLWRGARAGQLLRILSLRRSRQVRHLGQLGFHRCELLTKLSEIAISICKHLVELGELRTELCLELAHVNFARRKGVHGHLRQLLHADKPSLAFDT